MKFRNNYILTSAIFTIVMLAGIISAKGERLLNDSGFEIAVEEKLNLEDWMTNEYVWASSTSLSINNDIEKELSIESWMSDDMIWDQVNYEMEKETELELETWMIDSGYWNS